MKKITILLAGLLALAPVVAAAQQGPPAGAGVGVQERGLRAGQMRRPPLRFEGRMGMQGRMAMPGRMALQRRMALQQGLAGQRLMARQARMALPGRMAMQRGMVGQGQGMARMQGLQAGPLGPLADPQIRQQLNLTDAQVKQLEELRAARQADGQRFMEQMRADREKLEQELQANRAKWQEQQQQEQARMQERVQQLLTPEQRTKLEQLEAARPRGRGVGPGRLMRPDSIR